MKKIIIGLFFLLPLCSVSQTKVASLKNKFLKTYIGELPSYSIISDTTVIEVEKTPIKINLTKTAIIVETGKLQKKGSYHVLFKGNNYYVLDAFFEGDITSERIIVNERNKTIVREGIYPQPNCTLKVSK
ncbi:MAG: hypothetical protein M9916_12225 [Crocinitomicaceae bacterium]|nr:hypothetical protein [Crocinitomicaceae bacterium]